MLKERLHSREDSGKIFDKMVVGERAGVHHALQRRLGIEVRRPKGRLPFEPATFRPPRSTKAISALLTQ